MTIREPKKIIPTMKVDADESSESDLAFSEVQAELVGFHDVETKKFGTKTVATLKSDDLGEFQVFLNNYSLTKLNEAWGNDDEAWKGKLVDLKMEKDAQFKTDMIVLYPVA